MKETVCHHLYNDCTITCALYKDVHNAKELRQSVMNGDFEATLLKTTMIADPFQVIVAANRAVHLYKTDKMTTKNVHSEILFCLSATKNISDSFRKFGLGDGDTSVFVVVLNDKDDASLNLIDSKIQGSCIPLADVKQFTDEKLIKKLYKITDSELSVSSLTDALVSKIASKEFVTI
ncbi:EKC/KEOPS complex subunit TPRKB-like [Ruditapes philippinarum]|uniref:EKC/KEOPS complex subunit TPRKB-like n=1 Tax=Ruditapes philippinarum TaxID=129788 RepID=UPI00295A69DF|nr:EKC/KEOPS complex subunit TPRKB-like [Ruditapes philippinarum]